MPWQLRLFAAALFFFHGSELVLATIYMKDQLSLKSLLISWPYTIAMSAGLAEFLVESWCVPPMKQLHWVSASGLALVVLGEAIRKTAMLTAASNFTHDIRHTRHSSHTLVTHGMYRYVRHPGYLGWFVWAVATQILLLNPVCTLVFAYVSWRFFRARISYEDWTLQRFFGKPYLDYAEATPSGLPFIP